MIHPKKKISSTGLFAAKRIPLAAKVFFTCGKKKILCATRKVSCTEEENVLFSKFQFFQFLNFSNFLRLFNLSHIFKKNSQKMSVLRIHRQWTIWWPPSMLERRIFFFITFAEKYGLKSPCTHVFYSIIFHSHHKFSIKIS